MRSSVSSMSSSLRAPARQPGPHGLEGESGAAQLVGVHGGPGDGALLLAQETLEGGDPAGRAVDRLVELLCQLDEPEGLRLDVTQVWEAHGRLHLVPHQGGQG